MGESRKQLMLAVGTRYRDATLDNYHADCEKQQSVLTALREYGARLVENVSAGFGIVLFGPSGTGKDHLLVALAKLAIARGIEVRAVDGQTLFGTIRQAFSNEQDEGSILSKYTFPPILLLSDPLPCQGALTDFQASVVFRLIDRRYRNTKATWATLNVANGSEAEGRLTVPVVDRLRHGALTLHCDWPSYRRGIAEARAREATP